MGENERRSLGEAPDYSGTKEAKLAAIQEKINKLVEEREALMRGDDAVQQEK